MISDYKEIYFDEYCSTCINFKKRENEEPCYSCLNEPVNLHSHKPVKWESNRGNFSKMIC